MTEAGQVIWPAISTTVLALIFVCIRLYARIGLVRRVGLEDILIVLALLASTAFTVSVSLRKPPIKQ